MSTPIYTPVTWADGESLSSFVLFKEAGPSGLLIPAGMEGVRMTFFRAPFTAGAVVPASAVPLFDIAGTRLRFVIDSASRVAVFDRNLLRGIGYLGLRTEDASGVAVTQTGAATAYWLGVAEAPI